MRPAIGVLGWGPLLVVCGGVAVLCLGGAPLRAQGATAAVAGRATDPRGSAIADATLIVRNTDTGATRTLRSGRDGGFRMTGLLPGAYTVEAHAGSLGTRRPVRLTVTLGSSTQVALVLGIATVKQSTIVTARAGTVEGNTVAPPENTAEALVGSFLPGLTVTYLPDRDRDFTQLTDQVAATVDDDPDGNGDQHRRSAQHKRQPLRWTGRASPTRCWEAGAGKQDGELFLPLSAVREFQVLHSGVDASVGGTGAGLISVATKSGANRARGDAFYTGRPIAVHLDRCLWTLARQLAECLRLRLRTCPAQGPQLCTSPAPSRISCTRRFTTANSRRRLRDDASGSAWQPAGTAGGTAVPDRPVCALRPDTERRANAECGAWRTTASAAAPRAADRRRVDANSERPRAGRAIGRAKPHGAAGHGLGAERPRVQRRGVGVFERPPYGDAELERCRSSSSTASGCWAGTRRESLATPRTRCRAATT